MAPKPKQQPPPRRKDPQALLEKERIRIEAQQNAASPCVTAITKTVYELKQSWPSPICSKLLQRLHSHLELYPLQNEQRDRFRPDITYLQGKVLHEWERVFDHLSKQELTYEPSQTDIFFSQTPKVTQRSVVINKVACEALEEWIFACNFILVDVDITNEIASLRTKLLKFKSGIAQFWEEENAHTMGEVPKSGPAVTTNTKPRDVQESNMAKGWQVTTIPVAAHLFYDIAERVAQYEASKKFPVRTRATKGTSGPSCENDRYISDY